RPGPHAPAARPPPPPRGRRITGRRQQTDHGPKCPGGGQVLGRGRWKLPAARREVATSEGGPERVSLEGIVLRQHLCPTCASVLEMEVCRVSDPLLHDDVESWS